LEDATYRQVHRGLSRGAVTGRYEASTDFLVAVAIGLLAVDRQCVDETRAMADATDRGRASFARGAWAEAYALLSAADADAGLDLEDLERLGAVAYLVGRDEEALDVWGRAHRAGLRVGDLPGAARCAFWSAFVLLNKGELARGGGWVHRGQRLLDGDDLDCVERGYLRYAASVRLLFEGDLDAADAGFAQAAKIAEHFRAPELVALARVGHGRCLIYLGEITEGMALLDEAMVAISAQEVSPIAVGDLYCTVIHGCQEVFDVRRAQEWTAALSRWCDAQPDLVLYRGECMVHRAELTLLRGAWSNAVSEAQQACDRLAVPRGQGALGAACYVRAELHRLRGDFTEAEKAYRQANQAGRQPQPGLAQLLLAQGRVDAALAATRHALDQAEDTVTRARLLAPHIEIALAGGDVAAARVAGDELSSIAAEWNTPLLHALSSYATGSVLLAEGNAHAALAALRRSASGWRDLDAPYEGARTRVVMALACRALGDEGSAEMELDAARSVFQQLEAAPDLVRVEELASIMARRAAGGLTPREAQVLALLATGRTNRAIASELVISEKTVAAHVSSVFTKLGLSSRSAATAYAYEHHLV
jgi:DNA-binding NarL/FixJ family response regulator